jgi:hypothetical protein
MSPKRCFVIAPIGEPGSPARRRSDKILEHVIRPAAEECGYDAVRADELGEPGLISRQVVRCIANDPLVIADLTGHNPNVFYELALRHAVGKPLVQLIEQGQPLPFDVADTQTVKVKHRSPKSMERARLEIVAQIRGLGDARTVVENPVTGAVGAVGRPLRAWAPDDDDEQGPIKGKRLFQHKGYYPIDLAPETNAPSLNREVFLKALHYFLEDDHYDRLAAMDLVYLRVDNSEEDWDLVPESAQPLYDKLVKKYDLADFIKNFEEENKRVLGSLVRLVNDVGDTLKGVYCEILLHNVRNPIRSLIAVRNTGGISERRLYDPSTRFVVQYITNQGEQLIKALQGNTKVSYKKELSPGKWVKATTIPLYHERYGLVAILCMNIDIDAVRSLNKKGRMKFFDNYVKNSGHIPKFEL